MDKKNTFIGGLFLAAALGLFLYSQKHSEQKPSPSEIRQEVQRQVATEPQAAVAETGSQSAFATARSEDTGAEVTVIGNSYIDVRFTNFGGAIRDVAFKKYPAVQGSPAPFIFNELHSDPLMAFVGAPGMDRSTPFSLVSKSDTEVVYRAVSDGLEITRRYILSPDLGPTTDPYLIRCETTLRNTGDKASAPMNLSLSIGTSAPSNALDTGVQLTTEYSNGNDQTLTRRASLEASSGVLGFGAHEVHSEIVGNGPVVWATVKNQFFASLLTPDTPASALHTRRVKLLTELPDTDAKAYGITGLVDFGVKGLPAGGDTTLAGSLYVGPKEYPRLANPYVFKSHQDRIMDFGGFIMRFCAAILITVMTWVHHWTGNWGVAIILTTLSLKLVFLPFTLTASRSSKRMQKIQPEMKVLREKYKDNPQKQQAATMELFKKHKVNPMGGCLPMLFTLPFFFAMYSMLRSTAELRYASFLWAHDLSSPDTVYRFTVPAWAGGSIALNLLPIIYFVVIAVQMRLTPQPTVDNAQMKMMKFMPVVTLIFYYTYSCALSLYSTVNGLFTIGQQLVINRMKDTEEPTAAASGRSIKNVTPRKR